MTMPDSEVLINLSFPVIKLISDFHNMYGHRRSVLTLPLSSQSLLTGTTAIQTDRYFYFIV